MRWSFHELFDRRISFKFSKTSSKHADNTFHYNIDMSHFHVPLLIPSCLCVGLVVPRYGLFSLRKVKSFQKCCIIYDAR